MPSDPLSILLALLPPFLVLILMVGLRWGGSKAGAVGWAVAFVIGWVHFGAGAAVLGYAHVRAIVLTIDVVLIVWCALVLYLLTQASGAVPVIADWFTRLTSNNLLRVLLLGWVLASFLQGVGGFGVPVAVVAPLLVGLGLKPLKAVVIPSLGHAWAVGFGSLGASMVAMLGATGLEPAFLIPTSAFLLGISAIACGLVVAYEYDGVAGLWQALPAVLFIGGVMAIVQYGAAMSGLWNVASALGSMAGLGAGLWVTRWPMYRHVDTAATPPPLKPGSMSLPLAISGYVVLVVLAVVISGVAPIKAALSSVRPGVAIPEVTTSLGWMTPATPDLGIPVLAHTGSILLYSALVAWLLYRRGGYLPAGTPGYVLRGMWQKGRNAALGILTMVAMATIMQNAGMTRTLAEWLSTAVPQDLYAIVSTMIGGLGAFMTGSSTNSNAVFASLQCDTAQLMGLSVAGVLAIQTASASIASLLAPAKILVGASTVGMSGDEGTVLRSLLLYGGVLLVLIAVIGLIMLNLGF